MDNKVLNKGHNLKKSKSKLSKAQLKALEMGRAMKAAKRRKANPNKLTLAQKFELIAKGER